MKAFAYRLRAVPVTVKVPLMVAVLMVVVSAILSNQVLLRLSATQERHLEELTEAYLDGLSAAVVPHVLREDIWEIFDQLDRTRHAYVGVRAINTIVAETDGVILAASDPHLFPSQSAVPEDLKNRLSGEPSIALDEDSGRAFVRRALSYQNLPIGWIYSEIDIRDLLIERHEVLVTLILTNTALTFIFAGFGYLVMRRMIGPIGTLTNHLDQGRGGQIQPIPETKIGERHSEFGRLFRRYNAMVHALNERGALAARLAEEEKLASLGRLLSGMAHEINNPLGGMFNAIDTIDRHGEDPSVRHSALEIVKRGLVGIRDVVRSALVAYKGSGETRYLRSNDLDDLRFLVMHEVNRRQLDLMWRNDLPNEALVPAGPVRQAVLNLLLNACSASPVGAHVSLAAEVYEGELVIEISDQGPGLPEEVAVILNKDDADDVPPGHGSGLGAWMVKRLVFQLNGQVRAVSHEGGGTNIQIRVPLRREEELQNVA